VSQCREARLSKSRLSFLRRESQCRIPRRFQPHGIRSSTEDTMSQQGIVEAAKAQVIAYNDKNWGAATDALGPTVMYDEVGTNRKLTGAGQVIDAWKGWAAALPDSKATFDAAHIAGNT